MSERLIPLPGGSPPIIRSIPRLGYIFDVPSAPEPQPAAAGLPRDGIPSLIIGPLRNQTGRPGLQWAGRGPIACIAHGLSIDGRLHVQDAQSLEASWPQGNARMLQMLHATGARHAVVGSLKLAGVARGPDRREPARPLAGGARPAAGRQAAAAAGRLRAGAVAGPSRRRGCVDDADAGPRVARGRRTPPRRRAADPGRGPRPHPDHDLAVDLKAHVDAGRVPP